MGEIDSVVWTGGLMTWVTAQDTVLADHVASDVFDIDPGDGRGTKIDTILAKVADHDRARVTKELHRSVTEGRDFLETFEISTSDGFRRLAAKGSLIGADMFTFVVTECAASVSALKRLCLVAYDVARQEEKDTVAHCLMQSVIALEESRGR